MNTDFISATTTVTKILESLSLQALFSEIAYGTRIVANPRQILH
jgi:hypothetical protein